jgi:DNA-directed RNA polymerase subunit RPC12/RpoP
MKRTKIKEFVCLDCGERIYNEEEPMQCEYCGSENISLCVDFDKTEE